MEKPPSPWPSFLGCGFIVSLPVIFVVWFLFGDSIRSKWLADKFSPAELIKLGESYQALPSKVTLREYTQVAEAAQVAHRKGKVLILYRPLAAELPPEIHPDWFKLNSALRSANSAEVETLIFVDRNDQSVGYYAKKGKDINPAMDGAFQAVDTVSVMCGRPLKLMGRFIVKGPVRQNISSGDSQHNPEPNLADMVEAMKAD